MARMFPSRWLFAEDTRVGTEAERRVFEALSTLSQEFAVYHKVPFQQPRKTRPGKRSKRDSFEIDFLVTHRKLGSLVLEVKSGPVARREREWGFQDVSGWTTMDDPLIQMRDNVEGLNRHLKDDPNWGESRDFALVGAMAFPDQPGNWISGLSDAPAQIVATGPSLGSMEDWVRGCFSFFWHGGPPSEAAAAADMLHRKFHTVLSVSAKLRGVGPVVEETESRILEFTKQQLETYNGLRSNRRARVTGPAGSGKTLLAVRRAVDIAIETNGRVLITCFNKPLAGHIRSLVRATPSIEVMHFHHLVSFLVKRAELEFSPPSAESTNPGEVQAWWTETAPTLAFDAINRLPSPLFTAIVVDEAQDFSDDWWIVLESLLGAEDDSYFWIFGDDNQRIYSNANAGPSGISTSFKLEKNLRNTQRIFATFKRLVGQNLLPPGTPLGDPVQWEEVADVDSMIVRLLDVVDGLINNGVRESDIVILSGVGSSSSRLVGQRRLGSRTLAAFEAGVERTSITWETVRRFKGLEAPVIILFEIEPLVRDADELKYVALSRATSLLCVIGDKRQLRTLRALSEADEVSA